jgi:hypothetical protein
VVGDDATGRQIFTRRHASTLLDAAPFETGAGVL